MILAFTGSGAAKEITLNPGDSIQANITAAEPDDTLILNPGTYHESGITISKNIRIQANTSYGHSALDTIIDAENHDRIFTSSAPSFSIDNLTLVNGYVYGHAGGILNNGGGVTITSSNISSCTASGGNHGGGIYNNEGTVTIISTMFDRCSGNAGGALYTDGGTVTVTSSTFSGCSAGIGGAVYNSEGTLTVTSSVFDGCTSATNGGAISGYDPKALTVISSTFINCSAPSGQGWAIYTTDGSTGTVRFCRISRGDMASAVVSTMNTLDARYNWWGSDADPTANTQFTDVDPWIVLNLTATPSAIDSPGTSVVRANLTFLSNGTDTAGGGIFVPDGIPVAYSIPDGNGNLALSAGNITSGTNTTVFRNGLGGLVFVNATVDQQKSRVPITVAETVRTISPGDSIAQNVSRVLEGGTLILNPGIYRESGIAIPRYINIRANATAGGNAANTIIDAMGTGAASGGIFTIAPTARLSIDNLTLRNASATEGGAIYAGDGGMLNITSTVIANCTAAEGGGAVYSDGSTLSVVSSSFANCTVTNGNGGAIYATGIFPLTITGSSFENCESAGIRGGGAVYLHEGSLSITSSNFERCSAAIVGGAILTATPGIVSITATSFESCSSGDSGGGILMDEGDLIISSSTFANVSGTWNGGAIYASNCTITGSRFVNCTADAGGAGMTTGFSDIRESSFVNCSARAGGAFFFVSGDQANVTSSLFENCSAADKGGAITSNTETMIRFSRFIGNTADTGFGHAVNKDSGNLYAADNWWGTNNDPSGFTRGGVVYEPWLVMNVTAVPSTVVQPQAATVRVNLTRNSAGSDTAAGGIFVPDGVPAAFAMTSGTGNIEPLAGSIVTGSNTTRFTPLDTGTTTISATVDGVAVTTDIVVRPVPVSRIGIRDGAVFALDNDSSFSWNAGDLAYTFGSASDTAITGDWDNDGLNEIGVFNSGMWYLDYNSNGVYDGPGIDRAYAFGSAGFKPVIGDWNGDGTDEIGVELDGIWAVDYNGNGAWDGDVTDRFAAFGQAGDIPVIGDWDGNGADEIGSHLDGFWAIDYNGDYAWSGTTDDRFAGLGQADDKPVIGDWNGDYKDEIGMETDGFWAVDYNGNYVWDGIGDDRFAGLGQDGDTPVVGDFDGNGKTEICSFVNGFWAVDYNGNYAWDGVVDDRFAGFGSGTAVPVVGAWS